MKLTLNFFSGGMVSLKCPFRVAQVTIVCPWLLLVTSLVLGWVKTKYFSDSVLWKIVSYYIMSPLGNLLNIGCTGNNFLLLTIFGKQFAFCVDWERMIFRFFSVTKQGVACSLPSQWGSQGSLTSISVRVQWRIWFHLLYYSVPRIKLELHSFPVVS